MWTYGTLISAQDQDHHNRIEQSVWQVLYIYIGKGYTNII